MSMQFKRTLFPVFILSCIALPAYCQNVNSFQKCVTSTGWKPKEPASVTYIADDILPCIHSCVRSSVCHATYFSNVTGICNHHSRNVITLNEGTVEDHVTFIRNVPGIMVGKVPRYQYTYPEAMAACASLGGRMLTLQELKTIYQEGYEMCRCGWIEGNLVRFPMQSVRSGCGMKIGIITCNYNRADAWCQV